MSSDRWLNYIPLLLRVMFGSSNLFVLHHPAELQEAQKKGVKLEEVTYDLAQEEIAESSGFDMDKTGGKSRGMDQVELTYLLH